MTKVFKTPFGALGDKQEVPVPTQTDGSVSYEQGFGVDYNRDYEDPQAKDIEREKLNQLFYDLTQAVGELQQFGYMLWQAGEYQAGMRVLNKGKAYVATKTVSNEPPASGWTEIPESTAVLLSGNQTIAGVKTFSSFPVTPSAVPTANYQMANKKYVDDSAIGVGQTWQTVTRELGTTYTNSTGRPICVFSVTNQSDGNFGFSLHINGVVADFLAVQGTGGQTTTYKRLSVRGVVPAGGTYSYHVTDYEGGVANQIIEQSSELR